MTSPSYRVVRYIISGGTAAAANLSILYILTEFFGVWYLASSIAAVCVGWVVAFLLQKFWAFQSPELDRVHIQLSLHTLLSLANIALNTVLLYMFVEWGHLWYIVAQIIASGLLACMNYFVYKRYIFPSKSELDTQ